MQRAWPARSHRTDDPGGRCRATVWVRWFAWETARWWAPLAPSSPTVPTRCDVTAAAPHTQTQPLPVSVANFIRNCNFSKKISRKINSRRRLRYKYTWSFLLAIRFDIMQARRRHRGPGVRTPSRRQDDLRDSRRSGEIEVVCIERG